jgi:Predicted AAA-ATPase
MINLPYALAYFDELRRDNCFYVDRTSFIELLEMHGTRYAMFLRPRRFGKSLWISILEHYYAIDKASDFQQLFGDLYIGQHKTALAAMKFENPFIRWSCC